MVITEIYLWGAALVACFVLLVVIAIAITDLKMLKRMMVVLGATVGQMLLTGSAVWLVFNKATWWSLLIWYLLLPCMATFWVLFPLKGMRKQMLKPVGAAMFSGSIVVVSSALLCLPISAFVPVYAVLMATMTASMISTTTTFAQMINSPEAENFNQSWRQAVLPLVRSVTLPLVIVMPIVYNSMLIGGVSPITGLFVTIVMILSSFCGNILAGVVALTIRKHN